MNLRLCAAVASLTAGLCWTASANAAPILINFDDDGGGEVGNFYNAGSQNLGVSFSGWTILSGDYGQTSQPNFAYNSGVPATIDVAAGFTSGLKFTSGQFDTVIFGIYSGLDGTGDLLAATPVSGGDPFNHFAEEGIFFQGTAKSVVVVGVQGAIGIDDLELGVAPEPYEWVLMLVGLGALGLAVRHVPSEIKVT